MNLSVEGYLQATYTRHDEQFQHRKQEVGRCFIIKENGTGSVVLLVPLIGVIIYVFLYFISGGISTLYMKEIY